MDDEEIKEEDLGLLKEHAEDVSDATDGELSPEEALDKLKNDYKAVKEKGRSLDLNQAKIDLIRNSGGDLKKMKKIYVQSMKKIKDMGLDGKTVDAFGRVISFNEAETKLKDGTVKNRYYGLITDTTATLPYIAWENPPAFDKGDVVLITKATIKLWNQDVQLSLGYSTKTYKLDPGLIPEGRVQTSFGTPVKAKLSEIDTSKRWDITARVYQVTTKKTSKGTDMMTGVLLDDTGTMPFVAWGSFPLEAGGVYRINGAKGRTFRSALQLSIDDSVKIEQSEEDEKYIPTEPKPKNLGELGGPTNFVILKARVLSMDSKTVNTRNGEKNIFFGELGDETGVMPYTLWSDEAKFSQDQVVEIKGASVKQRRGLELSLDDRCDFNPVEEPELPDAEELRTAGTRALDIQTLEDRGGGVNVTVRGVLVDMKSNSGLVKRCTQCGRVLQNGECAEHGLDDGRYDLRIRGVLDDGTGTMLITVQRQSVEQLIGSTLDQVLEDPKTARETVMQGLNDNVLLKPVEVRGDVVADDQGLRMISRQFDYQNYDIEEEARDTLEEYKEVF